MASSLFTLALVLVGIAALLGASTVLLMAWSLIHPPRMTDGKAAWVLRRLSPADVGLPAFEDVRFLIRDERGRPLSIAAWWVPHSRGDGRCAVLIHGYADAKVGAIAWGPVWHSLEFNLLAVDLRAHGESGGRGCTAGYFERHDLSQVLDELRARWPEQTRQIVLFGVSMGGAVALATAAQPRDVDAVVLDSPYADFPAAAMAHMDRLGLPGRPLQRLAIRLAEYLTRASFNDVAPARLLPTLRCPALSIVGSEDPFLSQDDRAALEQSSGANGAVQLWIVDGAEHLGALATDPAGYQARLAPFLSNALPTVATASPTMPVAPSGP